MNAIKNFMQDEEGIVAIEYALMAALLALSIAVGALFLGKYICGFFKAIAGALPTGTLGAVTSC